MKLMTAILIGTGGLGLCLANSPPPFPAERAILDRIFEAARPESPTSLAALRALEAVALGRLGSADVQLEARLGLAAGRLRTSAFRSEVVREYALSRIADVDAPEALEFLQDVKKEDLEPDESSRVWPAALVALHQARLNRISGQAGRVAFLEDTVGERSAAVEWAVQELCNCGSDSSLPLIRQSIRRRVSTSRAAEEQIGHCEARIALLSRSPDRIAALGSFLSIMEGSTDRWLIVWAVNQLYSMKSARADAELARYKAELDSVIPSTVDAEKKRVFAQTRQEISELLGQRAQ